MQQPLIYCDSAATAQKPQCVLDAMDQFYTRANANIHRGMHPLAERATELYEEARGTVRKFLRAKHESEIIFTKSATEGMNLIAQSWGRQNLAEGDTVVLSILEHHSNIVPWLQLKEEKGINIEWIGLMEDGSLDLAQYHDLLEQHTVKLVSITGLSNVTGVRIPLADIIKDAHASGAKVAIDAAQLIVHHPVDVQDLDCDFLVFSGHKLYGPTGIGVLFGKKDYLESMPPFLGGGGMIQEVHCDYFSSKELPAKFEAGTPPIAEAIGLAAAIQWLAQFSWKEIEAYESSLISSALPALQSVKGLTTLGPQHAEKISGCISFTVEGVHPHDLTDILGQQNICLRAGHHCAQPLHEHYNVSASTRLSFALYNMLEEIAVLIEAIEKAKAIFLS